MPKRFLVVASSLSRFAAFLNCEFIVFCNVGHAKQQLMSP